MVSVCEVDWQAIGGFAQALATLGVGYAAYLAAVKIGEKQTAIAERQADIADRQTSILAKQTDLAAQELKSQLFERRLEVYEATDDYFRSILLIKKEGREAIEERYKKAFWVSGLLFKPDAFERIRAAHKAAHALKVATKNIAELMGTGEDLEPLAKKRSELADALVDILIDLPTVFGDEIMLGDMTTKEASTMPVALADIGKDAAA